MYINQVYKYEINNIVYVGGEVPEGATILETMEILNAEEGNDLIRISDSENVGANIWLHDGDVQSNYREETHVEPEPEPEPEPEEESEPENPEE